MLPSRTERLEARIRELELEISSLSGSPPPGINQPLTSHTLFSRLRDTQHQSRPRARSLVDQRLSIFPIHGISNTFTVANIEPSAPTAYPSSIMRHVVEIPLLAWDPSQELPIQLRDNMVKVFYAAREHFHFHMASTTLFERLNRHPSDPRGLHPALLNAILLAATCIGSGQMTTLEPLLLSRTRHYLQESLAHTDRLPQYIWASIILTRYLQMTGRVLESYTVSTANTGLYIAFGGFNTTSNPPIHEVLRQDTDDVELSALEQSIYLTDRATEVETSLPTVLPPHIVIKTRGLSEPFIIPFILSHGRDPCLALRVRFVSILDGISTFATSMKRTRDLPETRWPSQFSTLEHTVHATQATLSAFDDTAGLDPAEIANGVPINPQLVLIAMISQQCTMLLYNSVMGLLEGAGARVASAAESMASLARRIRPPGEQGLPAVQADMNLMMPVYVGCSVLVRELRSFRLPLTPQQVARKALAHQNLEALLDILLDLTRRYPPSSSYSSKILHLLTAEDPQYEV